MVSMVTSVSLAASSKRGLIVSSSSCILLTSSAVLRSYRIIGKQIIKLERWFNICTNWTSIYCYFSSPVPYLVQSGLHALPSGTQFLLFASSETWEDFEQFQVALGCHIVVSRKLGKVLLTLPGDCLMDLHTHQHLEKVISKRKVINKKA